MAAGRSIPVGAFLLLVPSVATAAQTWQCGGDIDGVPSQSLIRFEDISDTTYVSGVIQNAYAYYSFSGEMFGGSEGYVALTDSGTGERIDRVHIALTDGGYALQPEGGDAYAFDCR